MRARAAALLRSAGLVAALWLAAAPLPAPAQGPPAAPQETHQSRFFVWVLASRLGVAVTLYFGAAEPSMIDPYLDSAKLAAAALGATLPPFPPRTGDRAKDLLAVPAYLTGPPGSSLRSFVSQRFPEDHVALFDIAVRTSLLLTTYVPRAPESPPSSAAYPTYVLKLLRTEGPRAGLPRSLWKPLADALETNAPVLRVHETVLQVHQDVMRHLQDAG